MAAKYSCVNESCRKQVTATKNNRYRSHSDGSGEPCEMSSEPIPEHVLAQPVGSDDAPDVPQRGVDFANCPQCERDVKLTRLGYFEQHNTTLRGGERCPVGGVRAKHARRRTDVLLPGDVPASVHPKVRDSSPEVAAQAMAAIAAPATATGATSAPGVTTSPAPTSKSADAGSSLPEPLPMSGEQGESPGSAGISPVSDGPAPSTSSGVPGAPEGSAAADSAPEGPFPVAPAVSDAFLQPFSPFFQPGPVPERIKLADAMTDRGKEIATRMRETFYAYTNRNSSDNRSAQRTLGPSELGSPCDRQLAMKLLGIRPVNYQEGWAPFVGTAVHVELANMFEWANGAGSGRYLTEVPVTFGNALVPRGTLDLYDGLLYMVDDHKLMGRYSLDKLIQQGPSETYRIQVQTYGLGAEKAGLKVKEVAIIAWPRQESSLDKLYVHVEKYDRKVALDAIARVERIATEARRLSQPIAPDGQWSAGRPMEVAREFPAGDDCKWCPFYLKADKEMQRGCPGR